MSAVINETPNGGADTVSTTPPTTKVSYVLQ